MNRAIREYKESNIFGYTVSDVTNMITDQNRCQRTAIPSHLIGWHHTTAGQLEARLEYSRPRAETSRGIVKQPTGHLWHIFMYNLRQDSSCPQRLPTMYEATNIYVFAAGYCSVIPLLMFPQISQVLWREQASSSSISQLWLRRSLHYLPVGREIVKSS